MTNLRNAMLAATLVALPVSAMAQPVSGIYVGAGVGVNQLFNMKTKPNAFTLKSDLGYVGSVSAGYGFGNGLRGELEFAYRGAHSKIGGTGGDSGIYGVMANAIYDIDAGFGWMYPYIGAGAGYQWMAISGGGGHAQSNGNLAAQGIVGAAFPTSVAGLSVTADVRYLTSFDDTNFRGNGKLDSFQNLSGMIGLRYALGAAPVAAAPAPAAVPAAAPAPAPVRTYLVFFDWDKSDLTARARQIIAEAAQASTRVQTTRIEVDGHADKSGTARYNQALSMRRAQVVAAELVRLGVAQSAIDIQAFGDTKPLVPTADGVRELQNRRVEIILK